MSGLYSQPFLLIILLQAVTKLFLIGYLWELLYVESVEELILKCHIHTVIYLISAEINVSDYLRAATSLYNHNIWVHKIWGEFTLTFFIYLCQGTKENSMLQSHLCHQKLGSESIDAFQYRDTPVIELCQILMFCGTEGFVKPNIEVSFNTF